MTIVEGLQYCNNMGKRGTGEIGSGWREGILCLANCNLKNNLRSLKKNVIRIHMHS